MRKDDGKTMRRYLWFYWALVLFSAGLIFFFSAQDGNASSETSFFLVDWAIHLFHPDYDMLAEEERLHILDQIHSIVRVFGHFSEFALLGLSLRLLLEAYQVRRWPLALTWLIGTLYACTDEWHQSFVPFRTASWEDVGVDSLGTLFGAAFAALLLWFLRRRKRTPSNE